MKRAIISDIHGNLDALQAVMADIQSQRVDEVYCLGDIVGYGPNPRECLEIVMQLNCCILGNHDLGALFDPEGFSSNAEKAIFWTRQAIGRTHRSGAALPIVALRAKASSPMGFSCVSCHVPCVRTHTCLCTGQQANPLHEYVFPEDIYQQTEAWIRSLA